eukprot:XP_011669068.1 PREDICTED: uncharacterized protein LOC763160 [Strongylocentrotus purpuratus]
MHDTDTLKEISDEYYNGELSPEKALVFYLLENGAKLDVRDKKGNLPIHYAKDEVVKQMILSRLPSLEEIQSYRAEPSTPAIVSVEVVRNTSQEIELEDHGVSMFIPPGAVHQSDPCKITLTLLQDTPSVDIKDDESVACYGIRCDPPNMIFHQPVKIKIPHYALVMNPDQVKPNIVSRVLYPGMDVTITSRKRSSSSPHEPPYCKVYKRHLELYIGKCAEWWVLIPLEQQVIQHQLICTPYIPDNIERGQEFEVHLQMHADLPGMETDIRKEKQQQSYHKSHRSIPFSVESKSGDVTVTCHREGDQVDSKVLSLRDVCGKMRHNILLSVTPTDDDVKFTVITITITQAGRQEVSQSLDFIIRQTDGQEYLSPSEPLSFVGAVEEVLKSDLSDIDVLTIAQTMTVDQFYDLGVALGFTIQQLDVIEYRRFRDREQAIYDMLVTWRERQPSGQAAKETFLSLMESLDPPAEGIAISADIGLTGEIPDKTLLAFARQIGPEKFFEIGGKLGFNTSELQHIEHRTLYNRKNANIQMLSSWKASQTSGPKAKQTLKLVWESVQDASKAEKSKDGRSATGMFGALGGKLSTKSHGFTLHIPPGALEKDEEISLQVLTEIPEVLTLKDDELLVSHGFQCYPSGLRFKKPAKLIIPHCALVTAPNKVRTILYSWNQSGTPKRLSDPDNIICSVRERWLEVSISHFSGGFFAVYWDWLFLKGILLSCMSFLPRRMPSSRIPVLEVRFVKKTHDQKWTDVHAKDYPRFQHVKGDDDDVVFLEGTLKVACQLGRKSPKSEVQAIQFSDMKKERKVTKYFELDLTEENDETLVTLEVVQTSTQTIKFNTHFQGIDKETAEQNAPSPNIDAIPLDEQEVTDANILKLAGLLPPDRWRHLYVALRIDYSTAERIRKEFSDLTDQYIHLLQTWKAVSTRTSKDLNTILIQVESGGLVDKY